MPQEDWLLVIGYWLFEGNERALADVRFPLREVLMSVRMAVFVLVAASAGIARPSAQIPQGLCAAYRTFLALS